MQKIYHTTTQDNLESILISGLLVSKSRGKELMVWLHTESKIHWAIAHVQRRHGASLDQVVVLRKAGSGGLGGDCGSAPGIFRRAGSV